MRMLGWLGAVVLAGCSSSPTEAPSSEVVRACGLGTGAGSCDSDEERCRYVADGPGTTVRFSLDIGDAETASCLIDYLNERGLGADPWLDSVLVFATQADVQPLLDAGLVDSYSLSCAGSDCTHCADLDVDACPTDPFCVVVQGAPYVSPGVLGSLLPVGCLSDEQECGAAITDAMDPSGACWQFGSTCVPAGWSYEESVMVQCRDSSGL